MSHKELQLLNLTEWSSFFHRVRVTEDRGLRPWARDFQRGRLLEAYYWAQLGVHVGFLPADEAEKILDHHSVELFHRVSEFLAHRRAVPLWLETVWNQVLSRNGYFPAFGNEFLLQSELTPCFRSALMLADAYDRQDLTNAFFAAVAFLNTDEWQMVLNEEASADVVADHLTVLESVPTLGSSALLAGFFSALEQMATEQAFFEGLAARASHAGENHEALRREFLELERRIGLLQRWRLNLWHSFVRTRFVQIAEKADRLVRHQFKTSGLKTPDSVNNDGFLGLVRSLMDNWAMRGGEEVLTTAART